MNQILYWNEVALEANRISHTDGKDKGVNGPPLSSRALAMIHLAMYDAAKGTSNGGYLSTKGFFAMTDNADTGASQDAAIATAAHSILFKLYPSQRDFFNTKYQAIGNKAWAGNFDLGYQYGLNVAQIIWGLREKDPNDSDEGYVATIEKGKNRPDPNNLSGFNGPFYGSKSELFGCGTRWGLATPYALGTPEYLDALVQVRGKGISPDLMGTLPKKYSKRTPEETLIGIFWAYDGASKLGTPPRLYNQIVRKVVKNKPLYFTGTATEDVEQYAHLFAMVNAAMGDAGILAWEQKYKHNFWRPILGIREHDDSMGNLPKPTSSLNEECDPCWLPLGAPKTNSKGANDFTPNFPAYPSGHATFGAAALQVVRRFYGEKKSDKEFKADDLFKDLCFVSDEFNGQNMDSNGTQRAKHSRSFDKGLYQMILENGLSRVFLGVHWYFDAFDAKDNAFKKGTLDGKDLSLDEIKIVVNKTSPNAVGIGGVPLGLAIADDIFDNSKIK